QVVALNASSIRFCYAASARRYKYPIGYSSAGESGRGIAHSAGVDGGFFGILSTSMIVGTARESFRNTARGFAGINAIGENATYMPRYWVRFSAKLSSQINRNGIFRSLSIFHA